MDKKSHPTGFYQVQSHIPNFNVEQISIILYLTSSAFRVCFFCPPDPSAQPKDNIEIWGCGGWQQYSKDLISSSIYGSSSIKAENIENKFERREAFQNCQVEELQWFQLFQCQEVRRWLYSGNLDCKKRRSYINKMCRFYTMVPKAEQESWATSLILPAPCRDIQADNRHCWCANPTWNMENMWQHGQEGVKPNPPSLPFQTLRLRRYLPIAPL